MNGSRYATAFFMTRALFTTCGKNIFPAPNKSPTTLMPAMSGPSITSSGRLLFCRASSVSASMKSTIPFTSACERRSSTGACRHASFSIGVFSLALTLSAKSTSRSVASSRRLSSTSSTRVLQFRLDLFVNGELTGVDDRHVESGLDGVKQKRRVHRFAHGVVAAKRKRNVAEAAAGARAGQIRLDPAHRFDEIDRVIAMLFETGRDGEDVRIENDVVRRNARRVRSGACRRARKRRSAAASCRPGRFRRTPSRSPPRRIAGPAPPAAEIPLRRSSS